ncbi:MAG: hypothetical protein ACFB2Z_06875 [Maricaulaceae bacterium]
MDWILDPLVSVGPLRFGMSPDEVAKVIGPPQKSVRAEDEYRNDPDDLAAFAGWSWEHRLDTQKPFPELGYIENQLVEADFFPEHGRLLLDSVSLLDTKRKDVLLFLFSKGGDIYDSGGAILFTSLGLALAPPRLARVEPAINVAAAGIADSEIEEFGYKKVTSPEQLGL